MYAAHVPDFCKGIYTVEVKIKCRFCHRSTVVLRRCRIYKIARRRIVLYKRYVAAKANNRRLNGACQQINGKTVAIFSAVYTVRSTHTVFVSRGFVTTNRFDSTLGEYSEN